MSGPAAQAGVRLNDLLLTAAEKPLGSPADLTAAVDAAKDQPFKLKFLRGGKPIEATVVAALRPVESRSAAQAASDREIVERWVRQFGVPAPLIWTNGVTVVHPGAGLVLPQGVTIRPELPDDMTVNIFRDGKKPAEITVTRGKESWKTTEDKLSKLPPEVRSHVESLLHGGPIRILFRQNPAPAAAANGAASAGNSAGPAASKQSVAAPEPPADSSQTRQLDEMSRQIDAMQRTLQQMRDRQQQEH